MFRGGIFGKDAILHDCLDIRDVCKLRYRGEQLAGGERRDDAARGIIEP
jgi:hypothetical protein